MFGLENRGETLHVASFRRSNDHFDFTFAPFHGALKILLIIVL